MLSLFRAIEFENEIYNLSNNEISITMQSRKRLLLSDGKPWVKTDENNDFDVPMGCFDGAEVCELVGTCLLSQMEVAIARENVGFYWDDGLDIFKNMAGPEV